MSFPYTRRAALALSSLLLTGALSPAQAKSKEELLGMMKAAFPGYAGQNYLDMTAGFLFQ